MNNKLLLKTILSCLAGALIWTGIDFVRCLIQKISFADTFLTASNLIEMAVCMVAAGVAYYFSRKNKQ